MAVFDGSCPLDEDDLALISSLDGKKAVAIINKCDLESQINTNLVAENIPFVVSVSAKTGDGAEKIGKAVAERVGADSIDPSAGILTTERQRDCVLRAENAVTEGEAALTAGLTFDAVGVMLDEAIAALCELSGERVSETIVDEVFSSFCVGK